MFCGLPTVASTLVTWILDDAAGAAAGVSHGWSRFLTSHNWREAVDEARAAAARREQDIEEELKAPPQ